MKRILATVASAALAAALLLAAAPARADDFTDLTDPGLVNSGAAYSVTRDASAADWAEIDVSTQAGGVGRTVVVKCLAADGSPVFKKASVAVAAAGTGSIVFDPSLASTAPLPASTTLVGARPACANFNVSAAAGSGMYLNVTIRPKARTFR